MLLVGVLCFGLKSPRGFCGGLIQNSKIQKPNQIKSCYNQGIGNIERAEKEEFDIFERDDNKTLRLFYCQAALDLYYHSG
jgi:hypothetical protein